MIKRFHNKQIRINRDSLYQRIFLLQEVRTSFFLSAKAANKTEGKVFRKIQTNMAPSGGYCSVSYKIGTQLITTWNSSQTKTIHFFIYWIYRINPLKNNFFVSFIDKYSMHFLPLLLERFIEFYFNVLMSTLKVCIFTF